MLQSKSTGVVATPQSIQLTQEDLLIELDMLYVELTGNSMSKMFKDELKKHSLDTIMMLIDEKKEDINRAFVPYDDNDDALRYQRVHMEEEAERCDSFAYYDKF
jgi:hypothetical protein